MANPVPQIPADLQAACVTGTCLVQIALLSRDEAQVAEGEGHPPPVTEPWPEEEGLLVIAAGFAVLFSVLGFLSQVVEPLGTGVAPPTGSAPGVDRGNGDHGWHVWRGRNHR